ncbi:histone H3-like centromeric protein A isoform X1 [Sciurus carolinensis]|uniref:histone H3-like centromeric protein A isoform X1 n=1 Tax=Sciurus carolinensis TaxID=30640 RepID=UPI001FB1D3B8|nr:histone H3-like centromeric protein A isoform X1 [Sciurus carolinensis]
MGSRRRSKPEAPRRDPASPPPSTPRRGASLGSSSQRRRNVWLKQVKMLQKSTDLLIRKRPFSHLAREICMKFTRGMDFNWQAQALLALAQAAEAYLVHLFEDAYLLSLHAGRVTLFPMYVQLARRIRSTEEGLG